MKSVSYQQTLSETRRHLSENLLRLRLGLPERKIFKSCYVSGPMTGLPEYNVHSFKKASSLLRLAGWDVRSPHDNDAKQGIILEGKTGNEVWQDALSEFDYAKAMAWDLQQVCSTDCTIVLPGWEYSSGAILEVHVALAVGKPVYTLLSQRQITEVPEMESGFSSRPLSEGEVRGTNRDTDSFPTPGPVSLSESDLDKPGSAETDSSPDSRRAGQGEGAVRAALSPTFPTDSASRKSLPVTTGVLDYFPAALASVAAVSKLGNDKHNPGEPLHHARGKSMDHADSIARHLIDRGLIDPDTGLRHSAELAWRSLALLQQELEDAGEADLPRGADA